LRGASHAVFSINGRNIFLSHVETGVRCKTTRRKESEKLKHLLKNFRILTPALGSFFRTCLLHAWNRRQFSSIHKNLASNWHFRRSFFTFFTLSISKNDFQVLNTSSICHLR